jgi:hypothetical protein
LFVIIHLTLARLGGIKIAPAAAATTTTAPKSTTTTGAATGAATATSTGVSPALGHEIVCREAQCRDTDQHHNLLPTVHSIYPVVYARCVAEMRTPHPAILMSCLIIGN